MRGFTWLLVAVACATALMAHGTGAVDASPAYGGFDALSGIVAKLRSNIETSHRVSRAKYTRDEEACNATGTPLAEEVAKREATLAEARERLANATRDANSTRTDVEPLNERMAAARLEMGRLGKRIRDGDADREAEFNMFHDKITDAEAVADTVGKVVDKLSQVNLTTFEFREVLRRAGEEVSSRQTASASVAGKERLSSLVADAVTALQSASASAAEPAKGASGGITFKTGEEKTLVRLRSLLTLLQTELLQYAKSLKQHDSDEAEDWKQHRELLVRHVDEEFAKATAANDKKKKLMERVSSLEKEADEARAIVEGKVNDELRKWKQRLDAVNERCELRHKHFEAEDASRKEQMETLEALNKLIIPHAQSLQDLGIGGIDVPKPTGCCVKCDDARPVACGNVCMSEDEAKSTRCFKGCACDAQDVRLVAFE